jgi:hypothetical protein
MTPDSDCQDTRSPLSLQGVPVLLHWLLTVAESAVRVIPAQRTAYLQRTTMKINDAPRVPNPLPADGHADRIGTAEKARKAYGKSAAAPPAPIAPATTPTAWKSRTRDGPCRSPRRP